MQTNNQIGPHQRDGFTLIELLTVIAIIGILAAIIIPTVGSVKVSANKSKTKAQFSQWSTAIGLFKSEYGFYPGIASSNKIDSEAFFGGLTGKNYDGTAATKLAGNTKKLSFYSASESEVTLTANGDLSNGLIKDAFGNTQIAVFMDTDNDNILSSAEVSKIDLTPIDGGTVRPSIDMSKGVRAPVVFYSPGRGLSATDIVYSW